MGERFPLEDELRGLEQRTVEDGLGKTTDFDDVDAIFEDLVESLGLRTFVRDHREYGIALVKQSHTNRTEPFLLRQELFDMTARALAGGWTGPQVEDAVQETRSELDLSSMLTEATVKDALKGVICGALAAGLSRPAIIEALDDLGARVLEHPEEFKHPDEFA
jgi:hypothetical protein